MFALESDDVAGDAGNGAEVLEGSHVVLAVVHRLVPVVVLSAALADLLDVHELEADKTVSLQSLFEPLRSLRRSQPRNHCRSSPRCKC